MKPAVVFPLITLIFYCLVPSLQARADDMFTKARRGMIQAIEKDVRQTSRYLDRKSLDPAVMSAMVHVPRHEFVPASYRGSAYENRPLPIGHGQTISQPYIVAIMSDLLNIKKEDQVLEIGTGSGYQAAILGELAKKVFTIEIVKPLAEQAAKRLKRLGYDNVEVRQGDGYYGWEEHAPFDAVIVTAAASHIPPPLIRQLKPGGRMMIPVGTRFMVQQLVLVEKNNRGKVTTRQLLPVMFVPLTGGH
ncbi:MAG: protein-L-isoaspartate(D-aspartate) O-methyltransferase [Desulfobulbaceae bacterium]|nr:protein-L-isoaspartate(D-aspartate) O-methyltransferase [Desulfobulbaceae bacterium]MCK5437320.1 protein-L-isoaspartate(D-aspartate) O-methyltransferase [Desulfobulbaceae bacterium]MCK5545636.1 protein-L-isoaspartate(D-aspartate) O-methyltransferase [Desulfobulbaceae bacterium]